MPRRTLWTLGLLLLIPLACAGPARASDHLLRINEILPGGPGGAQFVELLDTSLEPFPSSPYKLIVYTSSGGLVGKVTLPQPELVAMGTAPYLVANAAQGGTPDEPLAVTLPAAGQVCYTRGAAETKIHCVSYGCPAVSPFPSEAGSQVTGSIAAARSAQRQADGSFGVGPPTPDAANAMLPAVACPGGGPSPGGPGPGTDRTKPVTKLGGKRRQRLAKLAVSVTVSESATVVARGSVKVGRRKLALKRVTRAVRAGRKVKLRLRLSRARRASVRAALAAGRRVRASVTVTATDSSGNSSKKKRTIRVIP